jgi:hypothetical protein
MQSIVILDRSLLNVRPRLRVIEFAYLFRKALWGIVTLPCEERERTTPQRFLSGRDDLVPRTHRRGA